MVAVPRHPVDRHVVRLIRLEERARVGLGTDVNFAFFCSNEEQRVLLVVEVKCCSTGCNNDSASRLIIHLCVVPKRRYINFVRPTLFLHP